MTMPQTKDRETDTLCEVTIRCSMPSASGEIEVECDYTGERDIALFMLKNAYERLNS